MAPPSLIVVDGFLADPMLARQRALALDYDPKFKQGNYPGLQSTAPLNIPGLDEAASRLAGIALKPQDGTMHGHCRLTLAGDQGRSGVRLFGHPLPEPAQALPRRDRLFPPQAHRV